MPILYVANTSKQHHDFVYRVPGDTQRTRVQKILMGEQIKVHKDDSYEVLDNIVKQHQQYGLIEAAEVDRTKPFIGIMYQFDKPIHVEKFMYAEEHNSDVLIDQGKKIRQEAAAALHDHIQANTDAQLLNLQSEVVEETRETDRGLNEVLEVSRDPAALQARQAVRGGKRGRGK